MTFNGLALFGLILMTSNWTTNAGTKRRFRYLAMILLIYLTTTRLPAAAFYLPSGYRSFDGIRRISEPSQCVGLRRVWSISAVQTRSSVKETTPATSTVSSLVGSYVQNDTRSFFFSRPLVNGESTQSFSNSTVNGSKSTQELSETISSFKNTVSVQWKAFKDGLKKRMEFSNSTEDLVDNLNTKSTNVVDDTAESGSSLSLRKLWRRRHARSLEEGIRKQKADTRTRNKLTSLLNKVNLDTKTQVGRQYVERTLMGLVNALAEEVEGVDVRIETSSRTPFWRKEVDKLQIDFNRLSFKPLKIRGIHNAKIDEEAAVLEEVTGVEKSDSLDLSLVDCADEAFGRIDADNSGALDRDELASAIDMVSSLETDKESIERIASELVTIYDANGDGVVDREEYQRMVEDMAILQDERAKQLASRNVDKEEGPLKRLQNTVTSLTRGGDGQEDVEEVPDNGSIILSDLKLDLRRLFFGGIPLVKRLIPGGPLVLEPLTATISGSFNREDVLNSFLLDLGLRRLLARSLRVRLRSYRDLVDGAMFYGRRWKMTSKTAPLVDVLELSNVEFDSQNKMIITGRARVRAGPDSPVVTNAFKVRTKIGTGKNGQSIRLVEPELAFVFECPESWERGLSTVYERLGLPKPQKPSPLYSFFPIYSPFKVDENAGYDMGEDNRLKSIYIRDGALRFEMSAVLRPGRFLGNHYLAFTVPQRTFIVTLDRVKEGIRAARKNKKVADREKKLESGRSMEKSILKTMLTRSKKDPTGKLKRRDVSSADEKKKRPPPKSFFTRFVEGYTLFDSDGGDQEDQESLTDAIREFFGRQVGNLTQPVVEKVIESDQAEKSIT